MAKVLLSFSGNRLRDDLPFNIFPFYEGLINALLRNGNEVFYMIVNEFVQGYTIRSNQLSSLLDKNKLDNYIKNQDFDLVIAFNNALYDGYLQKSDIPYIIWGVDPISIYADRENLLTHSKRYIFAGNCEGDYKDIKDFFHPYKLEILRFATDLRCEEVTQEYPISFVGSLWSGSEKMLLKEGLTTTQLRQIITLLRQNTNLTLEDLKQKLNIQHTLLDKTSVFWLLHGIATSDRVAVLSALTDLGLHTFGISNLWYDLADTNLSLACTYDSKLIYDLQTTQDLFNRSKICFNMSHIHAKEEGFSFRVIDAMASNGCLVTDYKKGYDELFGKYVKLPTFEYGSPIDARKICQYLLSHEDERRDIVKYSQNAIDAGYRFEHRFKQIEEITDVKLFPQGKGRVTHIQACEFIKGGLKKNKKLQFKDKIRYKIWRHLDKSLRRKGIINDTKC